MTTRIRLMFAFLWIAAISALTQVASAQTLTIDDFSTGAYQKTLIPGALPDQKFQPCTVPSCVGGIRETYFLTNPENQFGRNSSLEINGANTPGYLLVEGGLRSFWGLYLIYGSSPQEAMQLHNVNLNLYTDLVIDVNSVDVGVSLTIGLFSRNGNVATLSTSLAPNSIPYSKRIPLADFYEDPANPIDRTDIGQIAF